MADITKEEIKLHIIEIVNITSGIKGVNLALRVLDRTMPGYFEHSIYNEALAEVITEGKILEVEYTLPDMPYKTKSIFFPKGTMVIAA